MVSLSSADGPMLTNNLLFENILEHFHDKKIRIALLKFFLFLVINLLQIIANKILLSV